MLILPIPADRAEQLEQLSLAEQMCVLRHLPADEAAEALAELDGQVARDVLENMDADDAARILSEMWPDDAVDVLDEVDEGHRDVLLNSMTPEDALELRALLTFDPDTAAGVMNTEIILVNSDASVDDAIRQIRSELKTRKCLTMSMWWIAWTNLWAFFLCVISCFQNPEPGFGMQSANRI